MSRGAALFDLLLSVGAAGGALLVQSAVAERITALDLLTGAILAACIWLIRQQYGMGAALKGIDERLKHVPTKKEVTDEIGETRHQLRNEVQGVTMELAARVAALEKGRS